jgi:NAD(P)-dependent dehydrogenase (short-subunit alcohol dehydrogenase family)
MADQSRAVLITGCSSGIGHATAERLARGGKRVYATARRPDAIADLAESGCELLALDVTDEDSMRAAVEHVEEREGAVGVLVNNAGYSQSGAIESVPMEAVRRQFETNVFGLARLTQLVLPAMRAQRWGRVVNISSIGGRMVFPGGGFYHASKYAVEAISDALRFEVAGFGIGVTVIEPGLIKTRFGEVAASSVRDETAGRGAYDEFNEAVATTTADAYENGMLAKLGGTPEDVAKAIEKAVDADRAPTRVAVTASARLLIPQRKFTPDRIWDRIMRTTFPQPK